MDKKEDTVKNPQEAEEKKETAADSEVKESNAAEASAQESEAAAETEVVSAADAKAEGDDDSKADAGAETASDQDSETASDQDSEETAEDAEKPAAGPDWKNMYARMRADFDNFRKRTERDREEIAKFAASDVLKDVLSTVDNLARALEGAKDKKDDPFVAGVQLVYDGLIKTLADHGATPLDSIGEPFDANFHEALATLPSPDVPEGNVINEVKRGWLLHGKLLRAAQVVVSSGVQG